MVSESGRQLTGPLVALATNDELDLALILIRSSDLDVLGRFCKHGLCWRWRPVVAVGNPIDPLLANTVTNGIISGNHGVMLQTNAAINGGNSGGPLINERQEIVGVNTLTINKRYGEGIGFAIRANFIPRKETWRFLQDVSDLMFGHTALVNDGAVLVKLKRRFEQIC